LKETGMLRRIDELGRIVIPKEIRKKLKIREGDNLDIFVNESGVVLKKYSPLNDLEKILEILINGFKRKFNVDFVITDKENIICSSIRGINPLERISKNLFDTISLNKELEVNKSSRIYITDNFQIDDNALIKPIVIYGDLFGAVLMFYDYNLQSNIIDYLNIIHDFCVEYLQT
jgi:AbrB family transcriptional regulator (stage V sporulation protein T)